MFSKGTILSTAYDDYTIVKQIGQGGSGTVFLSRNTDGEEFAIKAINKNISNKSKIKRFKNEMSFCSKNEHKNIIKILDIGSHKTTDLDCLFYVMPFFDSTLRKEIIAGIEPDKIIDIFLQLLSGLSYAHSKEIWHRDIKPENILYNSTENIVIIADFGIAHFCEGDIITAVETKDAERLANFTYASPEQRTKGVSVDGRADIYALGIILNEMFTKAVISGSNYRKIADVKEEYGFLDELVDKIICQDSNNRLFPVKNIEIELSALLKVEEDKKELKQILDNQIIDSEINDPLFEPVNLMNAEYSNNNLFLHLDKKVNADWDNVLRSGSFGYTCVMGHEPYTFKQYPDFTKNPSIYIVNIGANPNPDTIQKIVVYFKEWLKIVSNIYKQQKEQKIQRELNAQIAQRELNIKNKEKEMEINEKLKSLNLSN